MARSRWWCPLTTRPPTSPPASAACSAASRPAAPGGCCWSTIDPAMPPWPSPGKRCGSWSRSAVRLTPALRCSMPGRGRWASAGWARTGPAAVPWSRWTATGFCSSMPMCACSPPRCGAPWLRPRPMGRICSAWRRGWAADAWRSGWCSRSWPACWGWAFRSRPPMIPPARWPSPPGRSCCSAAAPMRPSAAIAPWRRRWWKIWPWRGGSRPAAIACATCWGSMRLICACTQTSPRSGRAGPRTGCWVWRAAWCGRCWRPGWCC